MRRFGHLACSECSAPAQLLELAELFTTQFGPLLTAISESRQQAFERDQDRMDSEVPLVEGTPELLRRVQDVMAAVDEYCARGDLLTLARPPELVALNGWSISELIAQYNGEKPTPWPGPF